MRRRLAFVLLLALSSPVFGSGGGYFRVWFVDPTRPAAPLDEFLGGDIGIVDLTRLRAPYRVPLFRSLSGLEWTVGAQTAFAHLEEPQPQTGGAEGWKKWQEVQVEAGFERPRYLNNLRRVSVTEDEVTTHRYFDNCNDAAFGKAADTWTRRRTEYADPGHLADWMEAQRLVFEQCSSSEAVLPESVAASAPPLVRADREYQIAAGSFYATSYDDAERRFLAIAEDESSPWRSWGLYLAARSAIRDATVKAAGEEGLVRARRHLETVLADGQLAAQHARAGRLLSFVRFRLEPETQRRRLATALLDPLPQASLEQEHVDFRRSAGPCRGSTQPLTSAVDHLLEWTACLSGARTPETWSHVYGRLQQAPATFRDLWLLAAASLATGTEDEAEALLQSLAAVPRDRAIAASAAYHRARLLVLRGQHGAARQVLDRELGDASRLQRLGDGNRLRFLRAEVSASVREMVGFSVQRPVTNAYYDGVGGPPARAMYPEELEHPLLVGATAALLNRLSGEDLLELSAGVASFPEAQRRALLFRVWMLGLLQEAETVEAAAEQLSSLVSGARAERLATWREAPKSERDFAAALLFLDDLELPVTIPPGEYGLRLGAGAWCSDRLESEVEVPFLQEVLPVDDRQAILRHSERRRDMPLPFRFVADAVFDRADVAPDDPEVPRALHLIVRRSRFSQCRNGAVSKAAFDRLHRDYRSSEWTRKTPYWYR